MKRFTVFLGLGSNIGDRAAFLTAAAKAVQRLHDTTVIAVSSVYESDPYGKTDQARFLNAVLQVETSLLPPDLFGELKNIETSAGRTHHERWGPREVDVDILLYDGLVSKTDRLEVPHADLANRKFVLVPFAELSPETVHPVSGLTVSEMSSACRDRGRVIQSIHHIVL